jgi:hypothetical protein
MPVERLRIDAVLEDRVERLLESLGILDQFKQGTLKCAFDGRTITRWNLHALFSDDGEVKACCDNPGCMMNLGIKRADHARNSP